MGFPRCSVAVELRDPLGVGRVLQVPEEDLAAPRVRRYPAPGGQPCPVRAEGQAEHPPPVFFELRQGFRLPAVPVADTPEADDVAVHVLPALVRRLRSFRRGDRGQQPAVGTEGHDQDRHLTPSGEHVPVEPRAAVQRAEQGAPGLRVHVFGVAALPELLDPIERRGRQEHAQSLRRTDSAARRSAG